MTLIYNHIVCFLIISYCFRKFCVPEIKINIYVQLCISKSAVDVSLFTIDWVRAEIEKYMREQVCETCKGTRFKKELKNSKL